MTELDTSVTMMVFPKHMAEIIFVGRVRNEKEGWN